MTGSSVLGLVALASALLAMGAALWTASRRRAVR
jgi:hypothetical protein